MRFKKKEKWSLPEFSWVPHLPVGVAIFILFIIIFFLFKKITCPCLCVLGAGQCCECGHSVKCFFSLGAWTKAELGSGAYKDPGIT